MELNDLSTWGVSDFTADNIRKVTNNNGFEKELINELCKMIFKEAQAGNSKLNLYQSIPAEVEKYFMNKGFRVTRSTGASIQKDNHYGSINW